ncbi:hypothetical protein PYW07_005716 [Mythimna separata]|uniref:Uncharacterized protein n=1 Tax=Mythimna separata TaxID=271217 RepID=A0AAD7YJC0_MYTSE|nr:hypothetical protein PYW07_005716 [Mythimna separata]
MSSTMPYAFNHAAKSYKKALRKARFDRISHIGQKLSAQPSGSRAFWSLAKSVEANFCRPTLPPLVRPDGTLAHTAREKAGLFASLFANNSRLDTGSSTPPTLSHCGTSMPEVRIRNKEVLRALCRLDLSLFLSVTNSGEVPCDVIYGDGRGHNTEISGEEVGYQNGIALLEFGKSIGPNSEATLNVRGTIRPANTNVNDNTSHHSTSDNQNGIASNLVSKANVEGAAITANTNANNLVSTANVTSATISANTDVNDNTQHHNQEAIPSEQADTPYNQSGIANNLVSMAKVTGAAITANTNANNLGSPANVTGPTITANTNANNLGSTANVTGATITANTDVHDNTQHHNQESNPSNLVSTTNVQGATITANTHVGDNTRAKRESEGDIPSNQAGSLPTQEGISSNPVGTPNVEDATKNKNVNDNTQHQTGPSNNQDVPSNPAGPPNVEGATPNVKGTPPIGSDEGSVKETNTSSSWGLNAGVDAGLSLGAGVKDGRAVIGANEHVGANIGGHEESSSKETNQPLFPTPPPNTYGPGYGLPYYPYQQFPSQFPPQAGQQLMYVPQPRQQYPQLSQFGPQYAQQPYGPQYGQQPYGPQNGQQPYGPQYGQQPFGPQYSQQPAGSQFAQPTAPPPAAPEDARVSPLCGPPGGHGGAHGRSVPRLGGAPPCPRGDYRERRPLAPGPGSGHGPERGGLACGRLPLRCRNARKGGC